MRSDEPRRRLFAPELPEQGGTLELPGDSVHHARVLRLAIGDAVTLFDGRAGHAQAVIRSIERGAMRCEVGPRQQTALLRPVLHLVLGLPKGSKLESIARMVTELGVGAVHLALCERSVARAAEAPRLSRLERIALEACAQSGQDHTPRFHPLAPLHEVAMRASTTASKLVFATRDAVALASAPIDATGEEVWAVVGPEGGLSDAEVDALTHAGFVEVSLGKAVLRVETAAPVIAALILERLGRFASHGHM